MRRAITWGFFASWIAVGATVGACGNSTPPAVTPADSASAPAATSAAADMPATATATDTAPAPTTPPPAPTAAPVQLPASFSTAEAVFFAQATRLSDAVSAANADCKKMGPGLNKVASDAAFTKSLKDYVAEAMKLTADQRDAAKANFKANEKKFDSTGEQIAACKKDPGVKAAMDKVKKTMMSTLKPLMDAFAGAMTGGATPTSPPPAGTAKP